LDFFGPQIIGQPLKIFRHKMWRLTMTLNSNRIYKTLGGKITSLAVYFL